MSVRTISTTRNRVLSLTAASALAAGALIAGAPASNADTVVDITGIVTNAAGAPLAGANVEVYVQTGNTRPIYVEDATTDATGRYSFSDLDAATRATDYPSTTSVNSAAIRAATSFKLSFSKGVPAAELHSNPGYLTVGYGGERTVTQSTAVPVNNTSATTANQAIPSAAGAIVRITGATGAPVTYSGSASLFAADALNPLDAQAAFGSIESDDALTDNPATPDVVEAPVDGLVYIYGVDPGTYAVSASGSDFNTANGAFRAYIGRFIGGDGTYAKATPITLTAGAFTTTSAQLTDALTAIQAPRIIGNSSFGSTLKADPGVWLLQQGTRFSYSWTRNGTPIATGPTYKVAKADKKKKIGLIVTAVTLGDDFFGTVSAPSTSKVGEKSKVKVAKASDGKLRATVKVAKKSKAKKIGTPTGKVVVLDETGKRVSNKGKLKGGSALLKVRDSAEGKLTVQYLGNNKLGSDTVTVKSGKGGKGKKK